MSDKKALIKALEKKALGNQIELISEEYGQNDKGEFILTKKTKKITKNDIDTQALLKLLEIREREEQNEQTWIKGLSDKELNELAIKTALEIINKEQMKRLQK